MNYHQLLSTIKTMLKIQFKHSKSVNGGARQVKGDSSVFHVIFDLPPDLLIRQPHNLPPFLGRSKRSTQIFPVVEKPIVVDG